MDRAGARASPPRRSQLGRQSPRDEIEAVLAPEEFVPDHEGRHAEHALLDRGIGIGVVLAPYRLVLRGLEEEGLVTSEWRADLPGPAKRTYALTAEGRALLDAWLESLGALRAELDDFLTRAAEGGDHVRTETSPRVAGAEP